jgi:NTE family protein
MEQVRGLQFRRLEAALIAKESFKPIWFSIDSHEGEIQPGDSVLASGISTNLTKLAASEIALLNRHATGLLAARLEKYAPELLS